MEALFRWLAGLAPGDWRTAVAQLFDILIVAFAIYKLMMVAKRSRAWQIMWGLGIFFAFIFLSARLQLHTINWLLRSFLPLGPVAIVILFYPELRHALEEMGRLSGWGRSFSAMARQDVSGVIKQIVDAVCRMSEQKVGALIVLEREAALDDLADSGRSIDAEVSSEILLAIFHPGGALHDGAVIIRGNRILAAGCILPLSDSQRVGRMVHTRHKAALGVTEESDAVVVVVSEETGTVSLSVEGKLHRGLNEETLTERLQTLLGAGPQPMPRFSVTRTVRSTIRRARSLRRRQA